jgi:hypothetical protein
MEYILNEFETEDGLLMHNLVDYVRETQTDHAFAGGEEGPKPNVHLAWLWNQWSDPFVEPEL